MQYDPGCVDARSCLAADWPARSRILVTSAEHGIWGDWDRQPVSAGAASGLEVIDRANQGVHAFPDVMLQTDDRTIDSGHVVEIGRQ
jgi:hypothetical protein